MANNIASLASPIALMGIVFWISPACANTAEYQMQYKTPGGQITSTSITPDKVRILSRKENMSAVCVETAALGKVWAVPALWMVGSSGGEIRRPPNGGQVAGGGNGFGSIREIPTSATCE